ncbi:hypothetical protein KM043_016191 [Ampulex compressa]|nr:hypothetical protein KM043_016191 [Ampulex compressa]
MKFFLSAIYAIIFFHAKADKVVVQEESLRNQNYSNSESPLYLSPVVSGFDKDLRSRKESPYESSQIEEIYATNFGTPSSLSKIFINGIRSQISKSVKGKNEMTLSAAIPFDEREDSTGPLAYESTKVSSSRVRREAENETKMEKIATTKNVREVRLSSPEVWSTQPVSIEFRRRTNLDQMIQEEDTNISPYPRSHQPPRAEFVTGHHRRSYGDNRESRDMPVTRTYDAYDAPWYRNAIRERDYEFPGFRRSYGYYHPDRYRTERDYYSRIPSEQSYYYDRYREDGFDLYGRSRTTPKPKRIIYYATLPEVVRKPVDLRSYPRPYDGLVRSPVLRDTAYKRVPGNVDPSRYHYRQPYDGYDSYTKRSNYYDRPAVYSEDEGHRKVPLKEGPHQNDGFDQNNDRKLANQILVRDEGKAPWSVQIGTEVNVKDDGRIPGRKIFGDSNGYERFQNAQLQKAPDATGSSELQSDN